MKIKLFEVQGKVVKATEHCYMISWLNAIIKEWPEDHVKILAYIFYMSNTSPDNPYSNTKDEDREEKILRDLQPKFDIEDSKILYAIEQCKELYETPTVRSYNSIKAMLEKLNHYLVNTEITDGRDGNVGSMLRIAKDFKQVRDSFQGILNDVEEENSVLARGKSKIPYDMK